MSDAEIVARAEAADKASEIIDEFAERRPLVQMPWSAWCDLRETIERHLLGLDL